MSERNLLGFFQREKTGADFLINNNFNKLKTELNLPNDLTALELSKKIINQA